MYKTGQPNGPPESVPRNAAKYRSSRRLARTAARYCALGAIEPKSTKVQPWIEDCVISFRNAEAAPAIELEAADTEWLFDERQLSRALHDLVANAVQHTPPDGWVKVTAAIENGWLGISVEDSGPREPDELKEKIFEPFVSSRSEGTGLGLAIAS
jgi:signal transduction histidine kinase